MPLKLSLLIDLLIRFTSPVAAAAKLSTTIAHASSRLSGWRASAYNFGMLDALGGSDLSLGELVYGIIGNEQRLFFANKVVDSAIKPWTSKGNGAASANTVTSAHILLNAVEIRSAFKHG